MPMPNPLAHMAEYASQQLGADVADADTANIEDEKPNTVFTPPPRMTILKRPAHFSPKRTNLDVQVLYVDGARLVYIRGKLWLGPMLSHMHNKDIMKILSLRNF
jgi:hypothetical protein